MCRCTSSRTRRKFCEGIPITTTSETAQHYFDQGLSLAWAFNHAAADFAFNEAALHDPDCAMCYWGSALVLGPNVNAAMDPANAPRAHLLAEKARQLAVGATPREQALTAALAKRYEAVEPADRSDLDGAYADAMREVADRFPEDPHILLPARCLKQPTILWKDNGHLPFHSRDALENLQTRS